MYLYLDLIYLVVNSFDVISQPNIWGAGGASDENLTKLLYKSEFNIYDLMITVKDLALIRLTSVPIKLI